MAEELGIARLRASQTAGRAGIMAWVQSLVIFLLLVGIAEDYNHDLLSQAWAGSHLGGLGFLLNGTLAAFYAGILIAVFFKGPMPSMIIRRIGKRRETVVSSSVLKFYDEISSLASEPSS